MQCQNRPSIQQVLDRHPELLFQHELGKLTRETAKMYSDSDAQPRFCLAQQVPYTIKAKVEAEINQGRSN